MGGSAGDYEGPALNQRDSISASFRTLAMQTDQTAPRPRHVSLHRWETC
jgi:hypothetical protein